MRNPEDCRFRTPGAIIEKTGLYLAESEAFLREDEEASELMAAMVLNAVEYGIDDDTRLKCPDGHRALKKLRGASGEIPWAGELRVEGSDAYWRLYFHDLEFSQAPHALCDHVLFSSVREEGASEGIPSIPAGHAHRQGN